MTTAQLPCQLTAQHPPLHILGGCRRPRRHPAHCLPISAISSALWLLATLFVLQQVTMDTIDVKSTGGTNFIISVWTAACNTQQPVDAGRHSKYCNSSVICRHNAIIWNVKWGYVDSRISNQAADGSLAGDGGFWNGSELTSDPVESFASLKPLASDSVERFSDLRGGGALHTGPDEAPAHLDVNFDSFLFDSAPAYIDAEIADDGLVASSFARSAAGDTVMDTMSNDRCRSHSAMQSGVARILDLEKPRFIWEALGLETEGRLRRPLLCRFDSDGKPLEQNLTASENSELLRQCLDIKTERRSVARSHSCEVTILSWLAEVGTELHVRRLGGHHLDVGGKSAETYARDSMAPAMRAVAQAVDAVIKGIFAPDVIWSGRFLKLQPKLDFAANSGEISDGSYDFPFSDDERVGGDTDATAADSSSDAGSTSCETVNDATMLWELLRPELRPTLVVVGSRLEKFAHSFSYVVHLKHPSEKKFLCGRVCNNRYESKTSEASEECPKCATCFGSKEALVADDGNT